VVIAVLAVIWVVALTPMLLRKLSERRLATSVDSFHRQLGSLRRAYPRLAANATHPEMAFSMVSMSQSETRRTPARRAEVSRSVAVDLSYGEDGADLDFADDPGPQSSPSAGGWPDTGTGTGIGRTPSSVSRGPSRAARRRRVLCVLVGAVVGFFLLGAIPGLRVLWDASLLAFGITAGYLALLIHFHRRAAEREMKVVEMQERWSAGVDDDLLDETFEGDYDKSAAGGR
jgi:hypothetical protein